MAEIVQAISNYFHGSLSTTPSGIPRTLGEKFKYDDTSLEVQVSKRRNICLFSDFNPALLLSQFITKLQQNKDTMSVQSERVDIEAVSVKMMDVDEEPIMIDYDERLKAVIQRERANRIKEQNDLFQAKKLSLVLDLDHTLLHSIRFDDIDPPHQEMLKRKEEIDKQKPQRHLFYLSHLGFWTKLRPGIWNFLEEASKLYELHICTMGGQLYADEITRLLDPTGSLFGGRVMSKFGNGIKDLVGVLGMDSTAIIMDDTLKSSFLELRCDERPDRGVLACAMKMIELVHRRFYSNPRTSLSKVDVRFILEEEKRSILAGCNILCTTVDRAEPDQDPMWQAAKQFGAICTTEMDSRVTHVVSDTSGINEVNWARVTGRFVVSPDWIRYSVFLYRRANESDFAVE